MTTEKGTASFEKEAKKHLGEWRKAEKGKIVENLRLHLGDNSLLAIGTFSKRTKKVKDETSKDTTKNGEIKSKDKKETDKKESKDNEMKKPMVENTSKEDQDSFKQKDNKDSKIDEKKKSKSTKETNYDLTKVSSENKSVPSNNYAAVIKPPPKFVPATGVPPAGTLPIGQGSKITFESDQESSEDEEKSIKPTKNTPNSLKRTKPTDTDDSDSNTSTSTSSSCSSSSDDQSDEAVQFIRKHNEKPKTDVQFIPKHNEKPKTDAKKVKSEHSKAVPFQRVDPAKVEFLDDRLRSNNFLDKAGAAGSYGERAYQDLAPTRGKGFRQEKNKKKRGSYHGGRIDGSAVNSIKFPSSEDES